MRGERTAPSARPTFADLDLLNPLLDALHQRGYETPTPIQAQAIPLLLDGRDLLGVAQTGTGKTAAFALPMLDILSDPYRDLAPGRPRGLVLTPTRELASQVADNFEAYGRHLEIESTVLFGGVNQNPQVRRLKRGVDVLVATPGRLLDLMGQGHVDLCEVEIFVLDEADRMLDMGFLRDVRRIVDALPTKRQSLLFSATMPPEIAALAHTMLVDPVRIEVTPPSTTVERIEQTVHFVEKQRKRALLVEILENRSIDRVLVFSRTKHGANHLVRHLVKHGIQAAALHGNKSQAARERALAGFRTGSVRALVATDIAARGLDVPGITHVINFDLPNVPESYVHRIGRTARAGREGVAISFCDGSELGYLKDIEREIRQRLDTVGEPPAARPAQTSGGGGRGRSNGGRRSGGRHRGTRGRQASTGRSRGGTRRRARRRR
ncbi:MAG: DEAD/DEAH box helicase [Planctomycetota bacterium]|nr:DEAD/DEAH box helicase [Planctomycetota bacterium]